MTTTALCSCDESKHWKDRAVRAELSLKFANQQLEKLLARVNQALRDEENAAAELGDAGPAAEDAG